MLKTDSALRSKSIYKNYAKSPVDPERLKCPPRYLYYITTKNGRKDLRTLEYRGKGWKEGGIPELFIKEFNENVWKHPFIEVSEIWAGVLKENV